MTVTPSPKRKSFPGRVPEPGRTRGPLAGAQIDGVIDGGVKDSANTCIISSNMLTGVKVSESDFLGFYADQITAIPEGNDYDLFGWAKPISNKISLTRALTFSWLNPKKKYNLNTNTNGEHRAFV